MNKELQQISKCLQDSVKEIAFLIRSNDPSKIGSISNTGNASGDKVKKLDILTNDIMKEKLLKCDFVKYIASEEEEELVEINKNGKYFVSFDPLDGSSNIDSNISVGTIFCVFKYDENDTIKNGRNIVMSGYSVYGGSTLLVIGLEDKVMIMYLDPVTNEWIVADDNFKLSREGKYYAINESYKYLYQSEINNYLDHLIENNYNARWTGSLVADIHRTLIKGGIVLYPNNEKNVTGKIRLLYEAYPIAHIIEKAKGQSSNGNKSLLDVDFPWDNIHQRTPIYCGSKKEMILLDMFI